MALDRYARWEPGDDTRRIAAVIRSLQGDAAAQAYLDAGRPGFAVIAAGYANPAEALGAPVGPCVPHWSGVFYWPFRKGEIVVLTGGPDGREPEDGAHPCQRRPAKWPVRVEWFGPDLWAARARSMEVAWSPAVALVDPGDVEGEVARVPVVLATCAWCGVKANRASMEPINNGGSVASRNPHECRQRIDDADRVSGTEALALYAEQTGFDA
jgi:hypothetical protein